MNDELLGFSVFKLLNSYYQEKQANVVYTNFLEYHQSREQILKGYCSIYNQTVIN
jgi:hypothetical protein